MLAGPGWASLLFLSIVYCCSPAALLQQNYDQPGVLDAYEEHLLPLLHLRATLNPHRIPVVSFSAAVYHEQCSSNDLSINCMHRNSHMTSLGVQEQYCIQVAVLWPDRSHFLSC
jgi:hypothetical protein